MSSTRRDPGYLARLRKADAALVEAVDRLVNALPPKPSERDLDAIRGLVGTFGRLRVDLSATASKARRSKETASDRADLLEAAKLSLQFMPELIGALEWVVAEERFPLAQPWSLDRSPIERRLSTMAAGFKKLEDISTHITDASVIQKPAYGFVPYDTRLFLERMEAAWRILAALDHRGESRFLEIGCGAGGKLLLAEHYFDRVDGIELSEEYYARAELFGLAGGEAPRVQKADALEFEGYGGYHVLYLYSPMRDIDLENRLEQRLWSQIADGTIVVAPQVRETWLQAREALVPEIFVKGLAGDDLRRLAAEAMLVGPMVPPPTHERHQTKLNRLVPAIEAVRAAGFGF